MVNRDDDLYADDDAGRDDGFHADPSYHAGHGEDGAPRRRSLTSTIVVLVGLSAFGGIIAYAYNQGMRAGTETVAPVLRADPSPTKVRPDQPGGLQIPHQDKLVYERLNPNAAANGAPVERLLPPPEAPVDRPRPAVVEELPPEMGDDMTAGLPSEADVLAQFQAGEPQPDQTGQTAEAPVPDAAPDMVPEQAIQAPIPLTAPIQEPPRPEPAPAEPLPTEPPVAATAAPAPPAPAEPQPEPAKPAETGTAKVQVGAVDSDAKAKSEWARLQKLHPELAGLTLTVQKVDLGAKGIFHRIQGSGLSEAEAGRICAALKAKGAGCIVVK